MIQICDSKKRKGEFFVRTVGRNGEKLSHSETLKTKQAVDKHIAAMAAEWIYVGSIVVKPIEMFSEFGIVDCLKDLTKCQHWAKKYGIEGK